MPTATTGLPTPSSSTASRLQRELVANMEQLRRLYAEEKEARNEAEQELMQALRLVKQAQTMAANARNEAAALRRRLAATEENARVMETTLRRQLAEGEMNELQTQSSAPQRHGLTRDEIVSSDTGFNRT